MVGVLRLFRSPLKEGEPPYALGNIDRGVFEDGVHKGEKKPKEQSLLPTVLEDGRLCWEMLDTEANRAYCVAKLPQSENPSIAYSIGYPEDEVSEDEEVDVLDDGESASFEPAATPKIVKKRGRKPNPKPAEASDK